MLLTIYTVNKITFSHMAVFTADWHGGVALVTEGHNWCCPSDAIFQNCDEFLAKF